MMVKRVFLLLTLFFLPKLANSSVIREEYNDVIACANDSDCGKEQFCSIETDYCEQCVPCTERFNRQPPSNNSCAKTEQDCGYCLLGYVADSWTNERISSTKCYKPSEKLVSSINPTNNKSETPLALTIFSVIMVLSAMVALGFFAYFFPKKMIDIWNRKSSLKTPEDIEMMDVESAPEPSAPFADSDRKDDESAEESEQLMNSTLVLHPNIQENRHCGAVPVGPHHVYHRNGEIAPLIVHESSSNRDRENSIDNIDASETAASSSMESNPKTDSDEPPLLVRQISAGDLFVLRSSAVPAVFRLASDSDLPNHIRLSDHRTANSSDESNGSQNTVQEQSQTNENTLEVEMAIMVKRNNKNK